MRSQLQVIMAVLESLKEGPLLKTHVMLRTRTNWKDAHFALKRLTAHGFVEKRFDSYTMTGDGFAFLNKYDAIEKALGLDRRDDGKMGDGSGAAGSLPKPNQYTSPKAASSGPESP